MKLLRNLLYLALVVAMAAVGVLFALQNEMPVPLDLLIVNFEPRSLALWLLIAFALGGLLGMLMSSLLVLRTRAALASTNRQLARSRAELNKLRTAGLKDGE
ncbi:LapA family protein [Seongchinamella unica]|uniref:LapA family protein n=1 Tax=Seongchinamella unica TaxID=2547392 RepID=A0A4R5LRN4_9GAMM|nr:LapA family protein [Seongchinamella unica]TDG13521.1 LapA family protein [Seongchinamella unica]